MVRDRVQVLRVDPLVDELPEDGILVQGGDGDGELLADLLVARDRARIESPLPLALLLRLLLSASVCHDTALGHSHAGLGGS